AAAGALFSLPLAVHEMWSDPAAVFSGKAAMAYLLAGLVPGLFAYSAYSCLASAFGVLSTSLSVYLGPVVGALLSIVFLGEPPNIIHLVGARSRSAACGGACKKSPARRQRRGHDS